VADVLCSQALDGKHIYSGCCALRIVFSTLNDITVKRNDERSRDFTTVRLRVVVAAMRACVLSV
jgi:polypyrimidine tract-binding protein 2